MRYRCRSGSTRSSKRWPTSSGCRGRSGSSRSTTKASACRWTAAGTATPRLGRRGRSPSSASSTGSAPSRRGGGSEMCACRRRSMEGYVSLGSSPTGLVRRTSRAFVVGVAVRTPRTTLDEARRCHGGSPTRGGAVPDLPLIEAAKLWAKVSARTGAAYLTGRWGGCRVLVFENLERASEAEPSHFLFLGEAGEWPVPDQAAASATVAEPARELPEARAAPAVAVEAGAEEKPARRRRKARGTGQAKP